MSSSTQASTAVVNGTEDPMAVYTHYKRHPGLKLVTELEACRAHVFC
jgi:hypothetical protein